MLLLSSLSSHVSGLDNLDVLQLKFSRNEAEGEIAWLVAVYVDWIRKTTYERGATRLKKEEIFGFMKFKYKASKEKVRMEEIQFLW